LSNSKRPKLLISDANIIIDIIAGELVEAMFTNCFITAKDAGIAYQKMLDDGSRLPVQAIQKQLKIFNK